MDQTTLLWGIPAVIAFFLSIAALFTTKVYPARQERKSKRTGFLFWMFVSWAFSGICSMLQQGSERRVFLTDPAVHAVFHRQRRRHVRQGGQDRRLKSAAGPHCLPAQDRL